MVFASKKTEAQDGFLKIKNKNLQLHGMTNIFQGLCCKKKIKAEINPYHNPFIFFNRQPILLNWIPSALEYDKVV